MNKSGFALSLIKIKGESEVSLPERVCQAQRRSGSQLGLSRPHGQEPSAPCYLIGAQLRNMRRHFQRVLLPSDRQDVILRLQDPLGHWVGKAIRHPHQPSPVQGSSSSDPALSVRGHGAEGRGGRGGRGRRTGEAGAGCSGAGRAHGPCPAAAPGAALRGRYLPAPRR